jgi:NADH-quinone oxidoreductase subunit L
MFFAAGVGAYDAAMFHLFTHAAFKALLFLGAGSVIMGMHHEQDMRGMGGLRKYLPFTYAAMTIGTIAITGLGWPGVGGFAGFYSKDAIIEAAYAAGAHNNAGMFAFWIGVVVAGLTAYYSWRVAFMTFEGSKKWARAHAHHADEPDHGHHHVDAHHPPKESPATILVPLAVLSAGAILAGFAFAPFFLGEHNGEFWRGAIYGIGGEHAVHAEHHEHPPQWVVFAPLVVSVLGLLAAAWFYLVREGLAKRLADNGGPLHSFLYNKWFFDELYEAVFVKGAKAIGDAFKWSDKNLIDRFGPDGAAWSSLFSAGRLSKIQSGYVYHYAFVMLLGVAGLLTFAFWLVS